MCVCGGGGGGGGGTEGEMERKGNSLWYWYVHTLTAPLSFPLFVSVQSVQLFDVDDNKAGLEAVGHRRPPASTLLWHAGEKVMLIQSLQHARCLLLLLIHWSMLSHVLTE